MRVLRTLWWLVTRFLMGALAIVAFVFVIGVFSEGLAWIGGMIPASVKLVGWYVQAVFVFLAVVLFALGVGWTILDHD